MSDTHSDAYYAGKGYVLSETNVAHWRLLDDLFAVEVSDWLYTWLRDQPYDWHANLAEWLRGAAEAVEQAGLPEPDRVVRDAMRIVGE